jgi:hypothetical protein
MLFWQRNKWMLPASKVATPHRPAKRLKAAANAPSYLNLDILHLMPYSVSFTVPLRRGVIFVF